MVISEEIETNDDFEYYSFFFFLIYLTLDHYSIANFEASFIN